MQFILHISFLHRDVIVTKLEKILKFLLETLI